MNLKNHPLKVVQDVTRIFQLIRNEVNDNSDIIRITYDDNFKIKIKDLDIGSNFFFMAENPKLQNHAVIYSVVQSPQSTSETKEHRYNASSSNDSLLNVFKNWLSIVKGYHASNPHPNSKVFKHYQERIYETFKFLPDENDNEPLEPIKQKQLSEFVTHLISEFENGDDVGEEIINELSELNKQIPILTQGQIKNQISWTFARLMQKGYQAINRITKVSTDAGIGQLFIEGIKMLLG